MGFLRRIVSRFRQPKPDELSPAAVVFLNQTHRLVGEADPSDQEQMEALERWWTSGLATFPPLERELLELDRRFQQRRAAELGAMHRRIEDSLGADGLIVASGGRPPEA